MNSKVYKWCAVPQCVSTSIKTPKKLFVYVPHNKTIRNKWLNLARRDPTAICLNSPIYFCEDHFDLPNDMVNFMQYHVMGTVSQVRMKPGCIPTKFECQPDRRKRMSNTTERPKEIRKKQRKMLIEECTNDLEERSIITKHLGHGETSSGSSISHGNQENIRLEEHKTADKLQMTSPLKHNLQSVEKDANYSQYKKGIIQRLSPKSNCQLDRRKIMCNSTSQPAFDKLQPTNLFEQCENIQPATAIEQEVFINEAHATIDSDDPLALDTSLCKEETLADSLYEEETPEFKYESQFNESIQCHVCSYNIEGLRYACVQCEAFELCCACEAAGAHAHHYVLRVPASRPHLETVLVLQKIREVVSEFVPPSDPPDEDAPHQGSMLITEVKSEVDCEPECGMYTDETTWDAQETIDILKRETEEIDIHEEFKQDPDSYTHPALEGDDPLEDSLCTDIKPVGTELTPAGGDSRLVGSDVIPAGGDSRLVGSDVIPAGGDSRLVGSDVIPAGGDSRLVGSDVIPAGGDSRLVGSDVIPAGGDSRLVGSDVIPAGGDSRLVGSDVIPAGGDSRLAGNDVIPGCGNSRLAGSDVTPTGGDSRLAGSDVKTARIYVTAGRGDRRLSGSDIPPARIYVTAGAGTRRLAGCSVTPAGGDSILSGSDVTHARVYVTTGRGGNKLDGSSIKADSGESRLASGNVTPSRIYVTSGNGNGRLAGCSVTPVGGDSRPAGSDVPSARIFVTAGRGDSRPRIYLKNARDDSRLASSSVTPAGVHSRLAGSDFTSADLQTNIDGDNITRNTVTSLERKLDECAGAPVSSGRQRPIILRISRKAACLKKKSKKLDTYLNMINNKKDN